MDNAKIAEMTVNVVSAYVRNNRVDADEVVSMLQSVGSSLHAAANPAPAPVPEEPRKRRVVRRRGGKVVGDQANTEDTNSTLVEDAASDDLVEGGEAISDDENIVSEDDGEPVQRKHPEPMFED